jgi:hypothetical protein
VGWFFEFLKNHWYWFFEHLRMKESLVSLLWKKTKTESKNHWFSLFQKLQRADDFLEGTDREPVLRATIIYQNQLF